MVVEKDIYSDVEGQSEDALQQKCVYWFHNRHPELRGLLFSVPNGGARDSKEGKRLKLTGVVAGVSDLIFLYNSRAFMIEVKTDHIKSKQSDKQKEWQLKIEEQGFVYSIVRNLASFKMLIGTIIGAS